MTMDDPKPSTPEPALNPGKLTTLVVAAVILGAGIWGLLASITTNLLVPMLARVMEADPQSPLYLGKGDLNIPALLDSVLALCLAGIVFIVLRQLSRGKSGAKRVIMVRTTKPAAPAGPLSITASAPSTVAAPIVAPAPATAPPPTPQPVATPPVAAPPASVPSKPATPSPATPSKTGKPQPAKAVYYNIVGEPILPTEDD